MEESRSTAMQPYLDRRMFCDTRTHQKHDLTFVCRRNTDDDPGGHGTKQECRTAAWNGILLFYILAVAAALFGLHLHYVFFTKLSTTTRHAILIG